MQIVNATGIKANAPWETEECFPEKPAGHDYGYLEKGKLVGCFLEELVKRCSGLQLPEIELVWHPGASRLVPVRTAAFLKEALRNRERATLEHNAKIAGFNVLVFCLFGLGTHHDKGFFALALFFAIFAGVLPLYESWRDLRDFDKTDWDTPTEDTPFERYSAWVETRSTTMTLSLLAILITVWAIQLIIAIQQSPYLRQHPLLALQHPLLALQTINCTSSIYAAGLVKPATLHGQWWRLFTGPLLHGSLIHFLFNASALWGLGRITEALAGRFRLASVFALSAIGGSLFSLFLSRAPSVGASGGLLGLIGFLIVLGLRRRPLLPPGFMRAFCINVGLVAVMGVVAYSLLDNAAHLGGFFFGLLAGAFMIPDQGSLPLAPSRAVRLGGVISIAATAGFALFAAWKMLF